MQDDLFGAPPPPPHTRPKPPAALPAPAYVGDAIASTISRRRSSEVHPQPPDDTTRALAASLNPRIRLGASTWSYPRRAGMVWDEVRCVSIDRSFYRPLTEAQYARYAGQAPDRFRFVVKAPALVADALVRGEQGGARQGSCRSGHAAFC